ncbi:hypothetical protein ACG33_04290 [Steroidobacter denitrificans]|uniref:Uncharacterized protein n=1 Tax=Steroidobacter denitrificans TaxID=465721 RepID=A0A127F9V5_STEDE|nr:hypothetical protein ACG33_04290 [Steroidobacter denitrificans]
MHKPPSRGHASRQAARMSGERPPCDGWASEDGTAGERIVRDGTAGERVMRNGCMDDMSDAAGCRLFA